MSDFWRDRSVLVTGITGFLGGWLAERLTKLGADVSCVVRDGNRKRVPCMTMAWGDVTDQPFMERVIGESGARTVFHLAAQAQVGVASANPVSTFDTNVRGTWSVLEACRRSSLVEQVVVASSDKAYGDQPDLPYTEDMPLLGLHPYDASKACADRLAQCYANTWDLPVTITRLGNLYGGGDRTWSRLIPGTIRRLMRGERPVIRGDGKSVRDWLYVEDAVDAYLTLASCLESGEAKPGDAFNISLGIRLSVVEVIDEIVSALDMGRPQKYLHVPSLPGEIRAQWLDCTRAKEVLDWRPKHTFAEGLAKTALWYKENL